MAELEVLLLDNHLLAVCKPAGEPTVPDASGDESLLERAKAWVKGELGKPGGVYLGVVQRLDRPVSGAVLFARTSKAAARLTAQFRSRGVRKVYLAVVEGSVGPAGGQIEQWLVKDERANRARTSAPGAEGARSASTRWTVVARAGGRTLVRLEPETGRPHQLRVAASIGLGAPILGDLKYGASSPLADASVALHAAALELDHPTRSERMHLRCRPPAQAWWLEWGPALESAWEGL